MKKTLGLLLIGALTVCGDGSQSAPDGGSKDDGGPPVQGDEPAISLITPTSLFAGRSVTVQISGVATHFTDGSSVDFSDPAITVAKVAAGSSANLRATGLVGIDARLGAHDVQVTTAGQPTAGSAEVVTLKGGFSVLPALSMELPAGAAVPPVVPQGGIAELAVRNIDDHDNPFNTAPGQAAPQLLGGAVAIGGTAPSVAAGRLAGLGLVDALAPAGGLRLAVVQKNAQGQDTGFVSDPTDKLAVQVTGRAPTVLAAGVTRSGEVLAEARATNLYTLTTAADNQIAEVAFTWLGTALAGSAGAPPKVTLVGYLAPASGRFRDGVALDTSETAGMAASTVAARNTLMLLPKAGSYYFVAYASDLSGSAGHSYSVTARWATGVSLSSLKEPMGGDSAATPLATIARLDSPYYASDGAADSAFDEDFIRFTAAKTGRVYVAVLTPAGVSMGVGLRSADCITSTAATRYSASGTVLNEADVTDGTTYCVRVVGNGQPVGYQLMIAGSL